ncbi:hypothetical protein AB0K51_07185 [Kitasatospora sp. NPDC049285]|uniref:hypothetical protein n=1 Tax=Kitasatospora sp. NPDC049285 TaxID=3157096 RepID=UPI003412AF17
MTDEDDDFRYAPVDTLPGLIQRGRGLGAVWAEREPAAAAAVALACVRRDTRWDWQVDDRHGYLAGLLDRSAVPLEPLLEQLAGDQEECERGFRVLELLALRGSVEAREALRDHVRHGPWWQDVLCSLADCWPPEWWDDLAEDAVRRLDGGRPEWPNSRPWLRWRQALAPESRTALRRHRHRIGPTDAELIAVLRDADASRAERGAAVVTLAGRPGVSELIPLVPDLASADGQRPLPLLGRAVERVGAPALAAAREWAADDRPWLAWLGLGVLARHGEREDLPRLLRELERCWGERRWCGPDLLADGLGRFGAAAGEAEAVLGRYWLHTPHSYERPSYLRALVAIRPGAVDALLYESLWDCEPAARLLAVERAPDGTELRRRLSELRDDPAEQAEVRAAAAARLG